jgi:hypothetical protein
MGLVFPLQPVRRKSTATKLLLKTTSKKFTVGGTLIFIALILFSMYLAAGPLFQTFLEQGSWIDKLLAYFFYAILYVFPIVSFLCWFYQETLVFERNPNGTFTVDYKKSFGPLKFTKTRTEIRNLDQIQVNNWMGSRNMASIQPDPAAPEQKRYATRGHWMLSLPGNAGQVLTVERRAKKEDIDWLVNVIRYYFEAPAPAGTGPSTP